MPGKTRVGQTNDKTANQNSAGAQGSSKRRKILIDGLPENTDIYGNVIPPQAPEPEDGSKKKKKKKSADRKPAAKKTGGAKGQKTSAPNNKKAPLASGITKNVSIDYQKRSGFVKWLRALFCGIPYTFDNDVTMFQVYPYNTGSAVNAQGNACDQVIVYGHLKAGAVALDNVVEVYGYRDSHNYIVARKIVNKATGTKVRPSQLIPVWIIWVLTILVFALAAGVVAVLGVEGILYAILLLLFLICLPVILKILFGILFIILIRKKD